MSNLPSRLTSATSGPGNDAFAPAGTVRGAPAERAVPVSEQDQVVAHQILRGPSRFRSPDTHQASDCGSMVIGDAVK